MHNFKTFLLYILQAIVVCLSLRVGVVNADAYDSLNFMAGVSRQHDNNIFKTENNEESENITSAYAGLRFDKTYSLQRIKIDARLTNLSYSNNDFLNFTSKNYDAAWYWALTPKLTGTISAGRSESLNNFNDIRASGNVVRQQNINVSQNQFFQADFAPGGGWHLLAGLSRNTLQNSNTFNANPSFTSNSLDVGTRYDFKSGSSITLMNHIRKGSFDDRQINQTSLFDSEFKEREYELRLNWILSAKSQLNFVASYLNRDHENFSQRDYSGMQGDLTYNWVATSKINLAVSLNSRLATFQTNTESYTRTNTLSIVPTYKIAEKVNLRGAVNYTKRNFEGYGIVSSQGREDDVRSVSLGLDWNPTNYLTFGLDLAKTQQDSNIVGFDFDDTTASASANLMF